MKFEGEGNNIGGFKSENNEKVMYVYKDNED